MKNSNITPKGIDLVLQQENEWVRWSKHHDKITEKKAEQLSQLLDKYRGVIC